MTIIKEINNHIIFSKSILACTFLINISIDCLSCLLFSIFILILFYIYVLFLSNSMHFYYLLKDLLFIICDSIKFYGLLITSTVPR